ncbi:VanZ family protein [Vibrio parahaemolyticus]|uniref:VanZ family protein n=1 Tax=Vibrio parahaemolyticus TaxID=670 RepID=UPI00111EDDA6|nr:VanZ family protein [Vibrio parahaemolyticus]MBE3722670.1 VanZ family protein [Vibrio parahaemolyticus]TOC35674.1 VanZ family protein [Vibrio parahaemolyticus]HCG6988433.1 VanZ family protein [Vibrio parahaemolyticus]
MNLTAARVVILSYAILIAFLSLSSGELQDWGNIAYLDKMQHAMAYSGFAFLGCFCVWRWRQRWAVAMGILLFSAVIEWLQGYVGRQTSWLDLVANSTGILTGLLCYRIWSLYRPRLVKSLYSIR